MAVISGMVTESGVPVAGRVVRAYRRDTGALLGATVSSDGTPSPGDPDFASVTLLMHFDGADGSTSFVDSSTHSREMSVLSGPTISDTQSKFGGTSGRFVGSGAVYMADVPELQMGSDDFTVECWVYHTSLSGFQGYVGAHGIYGPGAGEFALYAFGPTVQVLTSADGVSWTSSTTSGPILVVDTWTHIAAVRHESLMRLFVDGVQVASAAVSGPLVGTGDPLAIGANSADGDHPMNGFMDEVRITKGVARYTEAFTPPTAPFPDSATPGPDAVGEYALSVDFTGEVQVVCLDDDAGVTYNDLILRTTPV